MPVTFGPDGLMVQKSVAADALTQLNLLSVFSKAAIGGYEEGAFEVGNTVTFRRVRITEAEEYDPRGGGTADETEPGYVTGDLVLEKLFTNGIPVYSSDYQIDKYLAETGPQIALSCTKGFDRYLYGKFRTPTHAAIGNVAYGVGMPIRIVANQSNGQFTPFDQSLLIDAGSRLEEEDVPPGALYSILSTQAKADYLGSQTPVDAGAVYAQAGVAGLLQMGLPIGRFVERMGFMVGSSNVIGRDGTQTAVTRPDSGANTPSLAIAAVADNTAFSYSQARLVDDYLSE